MSKSRQRKKVSSGSVPARFSASAPVGTDEYTLTYRHRSDGMNWSLVEGRLQTGQDGGYDLLPLAVLGGLVTATLLNLFVVPALYLRCGSDAERRLNAAQ